MTTPPTAFISYSWDSDDHKRWTRELATRLRGDGVDVKLDQWDAVPGDQIPAFMEQAIRENLFVLIVCTPNYRERSDSRIGGVGYEGDIMTAEVFTDRNHRKFIPVLREESWASSMPGWLKGKYGIDLRGSTYSEDQYNDLRVTLLDQREKAPPIGPRASPGVQSQSVREAARPFLEKEEERSRSTAFEPVRLSGVLADEVGEPKNDGSRGSALYAVPIRLSRTPSHEWSELFLHVWDHPPRYTTRHRPGIACVERDRIVLTRTTMEELRDVHRETLKLVVDEVNQQISQRVQQRQQSKEEERLRRQEHQEDVRKLADEIDFE